MRGLFRGWVPTAFGYSAQGAFKVRKWRAEGELGAGPVLGHTAAGCRTIGRQRGRHATTRNDAVLCTAAAFPGRAPRTPPLPPSQPCSLPASPSFCFPPSPPYTQFGLYEYFKKTYSDMAGPEAAKKYQVGDWAAVQAAGDG